MFIVMKKVFTRINRGCCPLDVVDLVLVQSVLLQELGGEVRDVSTVLLQKLRGHRSLIGAYSFPNVPCAASQG